MRKHFDYRGLIGAENPLARFPLLYEAAVDEFSQKKWEEASLNDILRSAGMSKGSFYYHFGDKFGLYLALADRIIDRKKGYLAPRAAGEALTGDFFDAVLALSRGVMDFMCKDERLYHLSNRILEAGPALIDRVSPYFAGGVGDAFGPLVRRAVETGQIDRRFPAPFVAKVLEVFLTNLHHFTGTGDTESAYGQLVKAVDMLRNGLSAGKESRKEC